MKLGFFQRHLNRIEFLDGLLHDMDFQAAMYRRFSQVNQRQGIPAFREQHNATARLYNKSKYFWMKPVKEIQ